MTAVDAISSSSSVDLDQFTKTLLLLPKTKYFVTPDPPQNDHDHCCSKFIFYFGFHEHEERESVD